MDISLEQHSRLSLSRTAFSSGPPLSETELADAFASLDFDETTRAALAQRLQGMQAPSRPANTDRFGSAPGFNAKRTDSFSNGYNRDPKWLYV